MDFENYEADAEMSFRVWSEIAQADTGTLVTQEHGLIDSDVVEIAAQST